MGYQENLMKDEVKKLIESIFEFRERVCPSFSIVDAITEYSFKNNIPIKEIGDTISEHPDIVKIVEYDLKKFKYLKSNNDNFNPEEW